MLPATHMLHMIFTECRISLHNFCNISVNAIFSDSLVPKTVAMLCSYISSNLDISRILCSI